MSLDVNFYERVMLLGRRSPRVVSRRVPGGELNVTYNLAPLFSEILSDRYEGGFWAEWRRRENAARGDLLKAWDMYELFRDAWFFLRRMPREHTKPFEPDNGWGSVTTASRFLLRCAALCRLYPMAELRTWR